LPRGLGEDPLVRQKKVRRRASAQSTVLAPTPDSMGSVSSPQTTSYNDVFFLNRSESTTVVVSSESSHDATVPSITNSAVAQPLIIETVAAEPVFQEPITAVPAMTTPAAEASVVSVSKPVPDISETFVPVIDAPVVQEDVHAAETFTPAPETFTPAPETFTPAPETFTPANVAETFTPAPETPLIQQESHLAESSTPAMDAAAGAPVIQTETQVAAPEPQKGGFFKRMFGRFQK
jgi:hypothetical protein